MQGRDPNLLAWQWSLYARGHRNRANLMLHILTVPVFLAGVVAIAGGLATRDWWLALAGPLLMAGAMAAQGRGHRLEEEPPVPFAGASDVVRRIFAEQIVTFPRFVVSGAFARALRASRR